LRHLFGGDGGQRLSGLTETALLFFRKSSKSMCCADPEPLRIEETEPANMSSWFKVYGSVRLLSFLPSSLVGIAVPIAVSTGATLLVFSVAYAIVVMLTYAGRDMALRALRDALVSEIQTELWVKKKGRFHIYGNEQIKQMLMQLVRVYSVIVPLYFALFLVLVFATIAILIDSGGTVVLNATTTTTIAATTVTATSSAATLPTV
jgi:hypothetical protein